MIPASTNGGGMCMAFPDVCKTPAPPAPPIPIPYPNMAQLTQATGSTCSQKVTFDGKKVVTTASKIPQSNGDEAGTLGGVASNVNMNTCEYMMYSFDVKFEGNNVCRMGDPLFHNKKNIMG